MNEKHVSVKLTAEWSQTSINFMDVTVSLLGGKVTTDLYLKPTDSQCKKEIPYNHALFLNLICSDPHSFNKRCIDLEKSLKELQ